MRRLFFIMMAVLACTFGLSAQLRTFSGTVLDATTNEPLIGVTVAPIGGGQAVATDVDGNFTLRVPQNVTKAKFTYVGYNPATVDLRQDMKVYMQSTSENLDELVVVAYGQQKKSAVTGSVSQVNADKIAERPVSSVASALEGTTSGITVSGNYGEAGNDPTITIRGITSINGSNSPLYVIDGVPYGGNLSDLNPDDIESMSILKDAASAALYGNRASAGVVLITTKTAKEKGKIRVNFKTTQGWYERGISDYEKADIPQWMQAQFLIFRNSDKIATDGLSFSNPEDITNANSWAANNLVSQWIYLNPFKDLADNQLFDENGIFNSAAQLKGTYGEDLDWWDQATRNGYRGEYNLNVMGATTKSDYRFSLGYLTENGYMRDNSYQRLTGSANINVNPVSWLKTGFKTNISHQTNHGTMNGVGDGSSSYNNAFYFCRYMSPIYPVHLHNPADGSYVYENGEKAYDIGYFTQVNPDGSEQQISTRNQNANRNVIWESEVNKRKTIRNTMNATAYVDFLLPLGFVASIRGNLNTRNTDNYNYTSALVGDAVGQGSMTKTLYTYKNYTFQQQLTWNYTFNDKHNLNVLLAHENYSYHYDYTYNSKRVQAFEGIPALSNFSEMKTISGYRNGNNIESYLGRVSYNFDDRYTIEGSFRRDGSSKFAKDVRWGNFGSVGANWVFSNEDFVRSKVGNWLNAGKIYFNWGTVGNDASADYYNYFDLLTSTAQDQLPAYYIYQLGATDLKWESQGALGAGIEATLFNRWNIGIEYYLRNNKDQIYNVSLPTSAGPTDYTSESLNSQVMKNIGTIRNQGFEINTDVDIVRTKDWKVNVGVSFGYNENKVTKLPDEYKYFIGYNADGQELWENGYTSTPYKIAEGKSYYSYYTYHWAGVDMTNGKSLYKANLSDYYIKQSDGTILGGIYKKNDAGQLVIDSERSKELTSKNYVVINDEYYVYDYNYAGKEWCGSALPKIDGSFSAGISWKNFSLSALFTYSLGGKLIDYTYQNLMSPSSGPRACSPDILNSWNGAPEGMTADSPDRINPGISPFLDKGDTGSFYTYSDRWLISRDYLCFKNINFTYSLPKNLLQAISVSNVKATFSAENLFLATHRKGLNPQQGRGGGQNNYLVPARVFTFGLSFEL